MAQAYEHKFLILTDTEVETAPTGAGAAPLLDEYTKAGWELVTFTPRSGHDTGYIALLRKEIHSGVVY